MNTAKMHSAQHSRSRLRSWTVLGLLALTALLATLGGSPNALAGAEKHEFSSQAAALMDILVHSVYKSQDAFLRELISNASDAVDKLRFLSLTDKSILEANPHLNITITTDAERKVLSIRDSGNNLGTIAKSGTREFVQELKKAQSDSSLIGRFGIGYFLLCFPRGEKVQVISHHFNDTKQYVWESEGSETFEVYEDTQGPDLQRGTRINLFLKPEAKEYLQESKLKDLINKYSEFVDFPIYMSRIETQEIKGDDTDDEDDLKVEDAEKKPEDDGMTTITKNVTVWDQVNTNKPIWTRPPSEVTSEQHNEFYKSYFKQFEDPTTYVHFAGEGNTNFKALVYIPKRPEMNLMQTAPDLDRLPPSVPQLPPRVIDSDDFPLSVSRDTIQQTRLIKAIKTKVIAKTLQAIRTLSLNETAYAPFYKSFATNLKAGVAEDSRNKIKLVRLLRFHSTADDAGMTSLDGYVERMRKGQKGIYYLAGTNVVAMRKSPYLEALTARGYEVLLLDDPYDEHLAESIDTYEDIKLINIAKGKLEFGDEDKDGEELEKKLADEFQPLTTWMTELLSDKVEKTVVSNRLTTSATALVASGDGMSARMQELFETQIKAQVKNNEWMAQMWENAMRKKGVLEINPKHPVIKALLERVEDEKADNDDTRDLARSLFDLALIRGGYPLKDVDGISKRIESAVRLGLMVDLAAKPEVEVKDAPEVDPEAAKKVQERKDKEEKSKEEDESESDVHDEL
ncbi:Hsp90B [Catenaria anguillulae PL171]|uniref:Hsp90B n=1 Tax=Catenaria anguillulae PL171 TaxID=765915 RepID=A0A1Y2HWQ5_9FUNG|nr:Hsp90B [Catenaria anguillulae PL171]